MFRGEPIKRQEGAVMVLYRISAGFAVVVLFILLAGCVSQPQEEEPVALDVEPVVDYYFLGGYTGKAGEGFYVIAGEASEVKEVLKKILAGEPARTKFFRDESLNLVVFRGVFPTGGYGIEIRGVERAGNKFIVRATFTDPEKGAIVTQAFTQPTAVIPLGKLSTGAYFAELYVKSGGEEKLYKRIEFVVE